jgi:hypothetical protein
VSEIRCYGYIPSFSGNIFLNNPFLSDDFFPLTKFERALSPEDYNNLAKNDNVFFCEGHLNDIDADKLTYIAYCFKKKSQCPQEIRFFDPSNTGVDLKLKLIVSFQIKKCDKFGLVEIETTFIDPDKIEKAKSEENAAQRFLKQAFINFRDTYFKHTHALDDGSGGGMPDSLTQASFETHEKGAIKEIIAFHQRKIQEYNDFHIKLMIAHEREKGNKNLMYISAIIRRQAKGCFLYGLNFILFYRHSLDWGEYELYTNLFKNAISGLDAFHEEAITFYSAKNSDLLKTLSLLSMFIGSILILIGLLNYSPQTGQYAPLLWIFWVCFVLVLISAFISKDVDIKFSEFSDY